MRIAITGGSGRIGRAVIEMAVSQGHTALNVDRVPLPTGSISAEVPYVQADITHYADLEQAFRGCEAVIHLAAIPSPRDHPDYKVHNNNVVGSYNALSAAAHHGIRRVCQASSINAIGMAFSRSPHFDYFPIDERHPTYNEDPYSLSKWICEQQADSFARRYESMTIASLRFHGIVPDRKLLRKYSGVPGDLPARHLWGYTLLHAAAQACLLSLTADFAGHEVFFIIAPDTASDTPSLELKRRFFPDVPLRGDLSGHASFFDCGKAERLLGWRHPSE